MSETCKHLEIKRGLKAINGDTRDILMSFEQCLLHVSYSLPRSGDNKKLLVVTDFGVTYKYP